MNTVRLRHGDRALTLQIDGDAVQLESSRLTVTRVGAGLYRIQDDAGTQLVAVAQSDDQIWVSVDGRVDVVEIDLETRSRQSDRPRTRSPQHELSAPMPATVVKLLVSAGDAVTRGQAMVMLEAMKMELAVRAPRDGTVASIRCAVGELVQPGVTLLELE